MDVVYDHQLKCCEIKVYCSLPYVVREANCELHDILSCYGQPRHMHLNGSQGTHSVSLDTFL